MERIIEINLVTESDSAFSFFGCFNGLAVPPALPGILK